MTEWREYRLSDIMDIISGGTPKTSVPEYWSGNIPWLSVADFNNVNRYVYDTEKHISELGLKNSSTKILKKGQLIISARGTVGALAQLKRDMAFNQSCYGLNANSLTTNDFLFYLLKYCIAELKQQSSGGVFDTIIRETFDNISVFLPPLPEQKAIAEVLSSLDDKIDLLTRQNKTLEDVAQVYFRKWFGEGEQIARMGDFFPVKTGKKDANIATDDGKYLFFTCSKEPLRTDSYSFDESSILLAGNGDFNVKWYRGKFEAYQRTYVLTPYDPDDMPWLYFVISNSLNELTTGYRGSVINFITKGMIEDYKVTLPTTENFIKFKKLACEIIDKQEFNNKQISILHKLRDTLLPKLISGEIRVKM